MMTAFSRFLSAVRSTPGSFLNTARVSFNTSTSTVNAEPVLEVPASPQMGALEHPEATVFLEYFSSLP